MTVHALIPAAGRGERLRTAPPADAASVREPGALPKQFLPVAGRPLLQWAIERLRAAGVASFVVAVPAELLAEATDLLLGTPDVQVVAGGATRQESVARALAASPALADDWVLVHDAARAAVHPSDVEATLRATALGADGAVLGRPVTDTVKRVVAGVITDTVDRRALFRAETPQVFRRRLLERALADARAGGFTGTDESSLVERMPGTRIAAVTAQWPNPKVTFAADLEQLERLLSAAETRP